MQHPTLKLSEHVQALVRQKEHECLEFKASLSSAYKAARELAALANTLGGTLLVGVDDAGGLPGIRDTREQIALVNEAASVHCTPPLSVRISTASVEGRHILVVRVPPSTARHAVCDPRGNQRVYVRVGDKNLPASRRTAREMRDGPHKKQRPSRLDRHELMFIDCLKQHGRMTISDFAERANLSRRRAARIAVRLERSGLLRSHDLEKSVYYTLKPRQRRP